tara:strand:- start:37 stop:645 length:609 start_codon:yes stop_codon:yes gene_type:complete
MDIKLALDVLNKDSKMKKLTQEYSLPDFKITNNYFQSLMHSIVFQQLSGKAANTIYHRLINLLPDNQIIPKKVIKLTNENMRKAGLSSQKINYIKNLAYFFNNNSFNNDKVEKMSNEEICKELIKIKGVGQWTIDMFLMFTLNRPDVMPYSDLGIQKGIKALFNLKYLPTKDEMKTFSAQWKPYRTVACWYLWKIVDDDFSW